MSGLVLLAGGSVAAVLLQPTGWALPLLGACAAVAGVAVLVYRASQGVRRER
jgi:hypothetical protein